MDLERLRKRLIVEEGCELLPYRCTSDKLSIGVGRNLDERGISHDTAMQMLDEDIEICVGELKQNLSFFDQLPDEIQEMLCDLAFNMGVPRLMTFVKTLKLLKEGDYAAAADELLESRYASTLPARAGRNADILRRHAR